MGRTDQTGDGQITSSASSPNKTTASNNKIPAHDVSTFGTNNGIKPEIENSLLVTAEPVPGPSQGVETMGTTASSEEDTTKCEEKRQMADRAFTEETAEKEEEEEAAGEDDEGTEAPAVPAKVCSACGKTSDTLQKCNWCWSVWYCDKDCQDSHWPEHEKECKLIKTILDKRGGKLDLGTELEVGPLGKLPPQEECPICMRAMPLHPRLQRHYACCGKLVCSSCDYQHWMKSEELAAKQTCAFCRTTLPKSNEEYLVQLRKRAERNDPYVLHNLAMSCSYGLNGLPVDQAKCIELLRESAGLGCPAAQFQLGIFHYNGTMGLEQNEEEALTFYKKAAEDGDVHSRHNAGSMVKAAGDDDVAAMRHCRLSASGGFKLSMEVLIGCFENGLLRHGDLAETLQAFYRARAELWSEDRIQYIAHLKETGKYHAEYEY